METTLVSNKKAYTIESFIESNHETIITTTLEYVEDTKNYKYLMLTHDLFTNHCLEFEGYNYNGEYRCTHDTPLNDFHIHGLKKNGEPYCESFDNIFDAVKKFKRISK